MSKEKQIEEMANDLAQHCPDLVANCCGASSCVSCLTRFLYDAGYRKQSEGRWTYGVDRGDTMKCTLCRRRMPKIDNARYCPNCGAKMKGGAK